MKAKDFAKWILGLPEEVQELHVGVYTDAEGQLVVAGGVSGDIVDTYRYEGPYNLGDCPVERIQQTYFVLQPYADATSLIIEKQYGSINNYLAEKGKE